MAVPALLAALGQVMMRGAGRAAMGAATTYVAGGGRAAGQTAAARAAGRAAAGAATIPSQAPGGAAITAGPQTVTNNVRNNVTVQGAAAQAAAQAGSGGGGSAKGGSAVEEELTTFQFALRALVVGPGSLSAVISGCAAFSRAVLDSNLKLAEFNSGIAASAATLEHANYLQNIRVGAKTEDSTELLTDAVVQMNQSIEPLRVAAINATNYVAVVAANIASIGAQVGDFIAAATPIIGPLYSWLTLGGKLGPAPETPMQKLAAEFAGIQNQWGLNVNVPRPPMQPLNQQQNGKNP